MKFAPWYIAAIAPALAAGCSGAFAGHLAILGVAFSLFFGTLALGRDRKATTTPIPVPERTVS